MFHHFTIPLQQFSFRLIGSINVISGNTMMIIFRYTTVAYRAPEMIDLYAGHIISTKSDIWVRLSFMYR